MSIFMAIESAADVGRKPALTTTTTAEPVKSEKAQHWEEEEVVEEEPQASTTLKSPFSRSRTVDREASAVGRSYLPKRLLSALVGRGSGAIGGKEQKSECDYQLVAESERLLTSDEYRDNSEGEEEEFDPEDLHLGVDSKRTTIDMKFFVNSSTHLVGEKKSRRKKLIWGGIIGAIVIAIIVVVVVLVTKKDDDAANGKERLELTDFLTNKYAASHFNGTFISDTEIMYSNENGALVLYNVDTKMETILLNDEKILETGFGYWVSPTKDFILIAKNREPSYRHSYRALYDILSVADKSVTPVQVDGEQYPLQYAQWNPVSNGLVFVFNNDIYYKGSPTETARKITDTGSQYVSNGVPDWVYEEEVFASNCALWFSPDGNKLAYVQFDDTPVRAMSIPVYGTPGSLDFQYTHHLGILYPKAGSPNPIATLHSVDVSATQLTLISHPYVGPSDNQKPLVTAVSWIDNNQLVAAWMNRVQNKCYIHKCTATECTQFATLQSTTGWVELMTPPLRNKDGSKIAIIASQPQDGGDSFKHVTLVSTTSTESFEVLTRGKFVVTEILKWDHETDLIFYTANTEANSEYLHLYYVKATVGSDPVCLSCDAIVDENNNSMTYYAAAISPGDKNVIALTAEGPSVPKTLLFRVDVNSQGVVSKTTVGDWQLNSELETRLHDVDLPTIQKDTIDLGNGFTAKVKMLLPPGLDTSGDTKYPMLIEVYGGPDSNAVLDRWSIDYGTYLSSQKDIVYVKIDGRGSGLRGDALMHQIYRKLGTAEIEDQTTTAKLLSEKYPYVDPKRVGIWGWSYGGYASAMALTNDNNAVLKCAASVAPVTDWTYYDSIYTERYMGLPSPLDNQAGYDTARLSTKALTFANKTFLLIHGTLDDNVHYQQAMALSRSLERNDIMFKQITYPDETHALSGVRPHLYHSLTRYFSACFELSETY